MKKSIWNYFLKKTIREAFIVVIQMKKEMIKMPVILISFYSASIDFKNHNAHFDVYYYKEKFCLKFY